MQRTLLIVSDPAHRLASLTHQAPVPSHPQLATGKARFIPTTNFRRGSLV
jgi:hypothetical protein